MLSTGSTDARRSRRVAATVAIVSVVAAALAALALFGGGEAREVAPDRSGTAPVPEAVGPVSDLDAQQRANRRLAARPCALLAASERAALGLPAGPGEGSVDFVAARCRWPEPGGGLALAVGVDVAVVDAWADPAAAPIEVAGADRAIEVTGPVLEADPGPGAQVTAVVVEVDGHLVVVERARTAGGGVEVGALRRAAGLVVAALSP